MRRRAPSAQVLGIALVALVVAALFVLVQGGARHADDATEETPLRSRDAALPAAVAAEGEAATSPATFGPTPEPAREAAPPAQDEDAGLAVLVLDAETSSPLGSATVWAAAPSDPRETRWVLDRDVTARGTTDETGRCRLAWSADRPPTRLFAKASDHRVSSVLLSGPPATEVVLQLDAGRGILGTVTDRSGAPIEGAEVRCEHVELPLSSADGPAFLEAPGLDRATATSDDRGYFTLLGLAEGTYRVDVRADGWMPDARVAGTSLDSPRPHAQRKAHTGDSIAIVMVPARVVVVRLVRSGTDRPVAGGIVTIDVAPDVAPDGRSDGWTGGATLLSYDAVRNVEASDRTLPDRLASDPDQGLYALTVPCEAAGGEPSRARVVVCAEGWRPATAAVALRLPSEAVGAAPDVVALEPEAADGAGTLRVDCSRAHDGLWRSGVRILSGCRTRDDREFHARGVREAGEVWRFDGLPVGPAEARVWDGISFSEAFEADLRTTPYDPIRATFAPPTGAVFRLEDEAGRRIFDADLLLVLEPGQDRGAPNRAEATRLRWGPSGALDVLRPLEPGEYRFAVAKRGHGSAAGTFRVLGGDVARVRARLRAEATPERQAVPR